MFWAEKLRRIQIATEFGIMAAALLPGIMNADWKWAVAGSLLTLGLEGLAWGMGKVLDIEAPTGPPF